MFKKRCFSLRVLAVVAMFCNVSPGQDAVSTLNVLGQQADRLVAEIPSVPASRDAWEKHRDELVGELSALLGLPPRQPMRAEVMDTTTQDDLVIEDVAYLWEERAYVSATVIRSGKRIRSGKSQGRRPAIVLASGWLGHYTFRPYRQLVDHLARQGLVVLFVDDPRIGKRHAPRAGLYATASAAGRPVAGIQVFDVLRGLDYLLTRADVDPGRIGVAGFDEGALQATLAAALEPRFRFVATVGMTTYHALVKATVAGKGPQDPSAFVGGMLRVTDMDRIAACTAPRPVLVVGSAESGPRASGFSRVVRTMRSVYKLYGAETRITQKKEALSDDMGPVIAEIGGWLDTKVLPSLDSSGTKPAACGKPEDPDFSMLRYMQRRIDALAASRASAPASKVAWKSRREQVVAWLRGACALDSMKPVAARIVKTSEADGVVTEQLTMGIDTGVSCPAIVVRPSEPGSHPRAGVILSHDSRECAASPKIADALQQLVAAGFVVIVPEHASVCAESLHPLTSPRRTSFYGDEAAALYGPADVVGWSPLVLRTAENLAAFRYLAKRPDVDPKRIVVTGRGLGGVDACLAALLETEIAGVTLIDATTMRDWARTVAPRELRFFHSPPTLPSMLERVDLDGVYAAIAPRPLVIVRQKDGWSRSGFEQVEATASATYKLEEAGSALLAMGPREVIAALEDSTGGDAADDKTRRQLVQVARTLIPTPPPPGRIGTPAGLGPRRNVDSAAGIVWLVAEMDGYEQEFVDGGFRLETWSFFNDNGGAQKGHAITPLILKKEGDGYRLIGIGKTRSNAGSGVQTFPFAPVAGTADVGESTFFGWHTGDGGGRHNPGVVEYDTHPEARMVILSADGQMVSQTLKLGGTYRVQSQYPRRYSVMAVSGKAPVETTR